MEYVSNCFGLEVKTTAKGEVKVLGVKVEFDDAYDHRQCELRVIVTTDSQIDPADDECLTVSINGRQLSLLFVSGNESFVDYLTHQTYYTHTAFGVKPC